jgi:hypothetical protein
VLCPSCEDEIKQGAKFCGSCGEATPKVSKNSAGHLTTRQAREWLDEVGVDVGDDWYVCGVEIGNRTQDVVILLAVDDDGDTGLDSLHLWSGIAPKSINFKKAVTAVSEMSSWGMTERGENWELSSFLFIESLTSTDYLEKYVHWMAIQADKIEEALTGDDYY